MDIISFHHQKDRDRKNKVVSSRELLLDEEVSQMRQLPGTCYANHNQLDNDPANDSGIGILGLVPEFGLALLLDILAM